MKTSVAFALFAMSVSNGATYDHNELGADWPDKFEMCARPDESPINIQSASAIRDASICDASLDWDVDWSVHSWSIVNNGHSLAVTPLARVDLHPDITVESSIEDHLGHLYTTRTRSENTVARLPNHFLPAGSMHKEFCLHSFHFHWGTYDGQGSEHLLDGAAYPLEVHFVHYSCKREHIGEVFDLYGSSAAIDHAKTERVDPYELAVVGIFIEVTEEDNPAFQAILSEEVLDEVQFYDDHNTVITNSFFLQDLVPENLFTDGYYSYEGSLTTPPCTSIVRWHVSNAKTFIGRAQLDRFREIMSSNTTEMAPNFRIPVQNDNPLYSCVDEPVETDEKTGSSGVNKTKTEVIEKTEVIHHHERQYVAVWAVVILLSAGMIAGAAVYNARVRQAASEKQELAKKNRERLFSASGSVAVQQRKKTDEKVPRQ